MSDEQLRKLERAYGESGSLTEYYSLIRARVRAGQLSRHEIMSVRGVNLSFYESINKFADLAGNSESQPWANGLPRPLTFGETIEALLIESAYRSFSEFRDIEFQTYSRSKFRNGNVRCIFCNCVQNCTCNRGGVFFVEFYMIRAGENIKLVDNLEQDRLFVEHVQDSDVLTNFSKFLDLNELVPTYYFFDDSLRSSIGGQVSIKFEAYGTHTYLYINAGQSRSTRRQKHTYFLRK